MAAALRVATSMPAPNKYLILHGLQKTELKSRISHIHKQSDPEGLSETEFKFSEKFLVWTNDSFKTKNVGLPMKTKEHC